MPSGERKRYEQPSHTCPYFIYFLQVRSNELNSLLEVAVCGNPGPSKYFKVVYVVVFLIPIQFAAKMIPPQTQASGVNGNDGMVNFCSKCFCFCFLLFMVCHR